MANPLIPACGGCGTCEDCRRAEKDIKGAVFDRARRFVESGEPLPGAKPGVVERVVFVGPELELWRARTLERRIPGQPTKLLVSERGRLSILHARYSEGREPGTWHRAAPPS